MVEIKVRAQRAFARGTRITTKATTSKDRAKRRASKAGLTYVNDVDEGYRRVKKGKSFVYEDCRTNKKVTSKRILRRIDSLAIPPGWKEVIVGFSSRGHIQAVGTDEAGRRQYIYHQAWQAVSTVAKFDRMYLFGKMLPKIRRRVRSDLNKRRLSKRRVLAAVVRLIDKAHLRVGNQRYVEDNGSHGATTLAKEHCDFDKSHVWLDFPAKSKQQREIEFCDAKVAKVVAACSEIRGQYLFQYSDSNSERHTITSTDVNDYLYEITGEEITAKDFRT